MISRIKETTHFIVNNYPYSNRVTIHNWCDVKDEPLSLVTDEYTVAVFHIKPKNKIMKLTVTKKNRNAGNRSNVSCLQKTLNLLLRGISEKEWIK
jgi:hypothetical protein